MTSKWSLSKKRPQQSPALCLTHCSFSSVHPGLCHSLQFRSRHTAPGWIPRRPVLHSQFPPASWLGAYFHVRAGIAENSILSCCWLSFMQAGNAHRSLTENMLRINENLNMTQTPAFSAGVSYRPELRVPPLSDGLGSHADFWSHLQSRLKMSFNHFLLSALLHRQAHLRVECIFTKVATPEWSRTGPFAKRSVIWISCQLPVQPPGPPSNSESTRPQSHQGREISFRPPLNESEACLLQEAVGTQIYKPGIFWVPVHPFYREESGNECKWMQTGRRAKPREALIQPCVHNWFPFLRSGLCSLIRNGDRGREWIRLCKRDRCWSRRFDLHLPFPQHLHTVHDFNM